MPAPSHSFNTLGGVPTHYDRLRPEHYGTRNGPHRSFNATAAFSAKLDAAFRDLWEICPFGRAEMIATAGAFVAKPGFHGEGRAFDLDAIFWPDVDFVTLEDGFRDRNRNLYFAVEAVLRMHFGQILNYNFNAAHRDHFHIDDVAPGFRPASQSATFFLQNVLITVYGQNIGLDGDFGQQTGRAAERVFESLGIQGGLGDRDAWLSFLRVTAGRAFEAAEGGAPGGGGGDDLSNRTPSELLLHVFEVIQQELSDTTLRAPVEHALNTFASHPRVRALLDE